MVYTNRKTTRGGGAQGPNSAPTAVKAGTGLSIHFPSVCATRGFSANRSERECFFLFSVEREGDTKRERGGGELGSLLRRPVDTVCASVCVFCSIESCEGVTVVRSVPLARMAWAEP